MTTDNSLSSVLFADYDAAQAAARALREAGFSLIRISEVAPKTTALPTFREFAFEVGCLLRRLGRRSRRGTFEGGTLRLGAFERSLRDLGVPAQNASEVGRQICNGAALLMVRSSPDSEHAMALMQTYQRARPGSYAAAGAQKSPSGLRVRKVSITQMQHFAIAVRREELIIEPASAEGEATLGEIRVPLSAEEVVIGKRTIVSDGYIVNGRSREERKDDNSYGLEHADAT